LQGPASLTTRFSITGQNTLGLLEGLRGLLIIIWCLGFKITRRNAQRLPGGVGVFSSLPAHQLPSGLTDASADLAIIDVLLPLRYPQSLGQPILATLNFPGVRYCHRPDATEELITWVQPH